MSGMENKLLDSIAAMKEMEPGVGPWQIKYCNGEKIILYNYEHIIACDITDKSRGIYSVIDLRGLKNGTEICRVLARCPGMFPSKKWFRYYLGHRKQQEDRLYT